MVVAVATLLAGWLRYSNSGAGDDVVVLSGGIHSPMIEAMYRSMI